MPVSITVKNTFLSVKGVVEAPARRSSSVPRTFKPGDSASGDYPNSDDSTNASDKVISSDSEQDVSDCCSVCTDDNDDFVYRCASSIGENVPEKQAWADITPPPPPPPQETRQSKVTLALSDMVTAASRTKLRSNAQKFTSVVAPPSEVEMMINNAAEVFRSGGGMMDVKVCQGGMGGTTMVVATSSHSCPDVTWLLTMVKDTLLHSAEESQNTYIMGYGAQPFNNLDSLSFSANIACVPAAHRDTACWDTYEKGFCPRCNSCRWDHPSEADMMRVIFMVKKNA